MSRLTWNDPGTRKFQTGVDKGVLFAYGQAGVAWSGLTAVTEQADGGESNLIYADNTVYLNLVSIENYKATIEAYTYPDEFEACVGNIIAEDSLVSLGLQDRESFHFSYRTRVGNDLEGVDYGYKLHLVYNAFAGPSEKAYTTTSDSPSPLSLSWDISTTPIPLDDYDPIASITVDSTYANPVALSMLESILYGEPGQNPRMPMPDEVLGLPWDDVFVVIVDNLTDPLPLNLHPGDLIFDRSTLGLYSVGPDINPAIRDVILIPDFDPSSIPAFALPGDLVYDENTGDLYVIGGGTGPVVNPLIHEPLNEPLV